MFFSSHLIFTFLVSKRSWKHISYHHILYAFHLPGEHYFDACLGLPIPSSSENLSSFIYLYPFSFTYKFLYCGERVECGVWEFKYCNISIRLKEIYGYFILVFTAGSELVFTNIRILIFGRTRVVEKAEKDCETGRWMGWC